MRLIRTRRAVSLAAAAAVMTYAATGPKAPVLEYDESPRRTAAGTWDDGRSMDKAANAGWWDWCLYGHWLLFDTERTRAITFGEIKR